MARTSLQVLQPKRIAAKQNELRGSLSGVVKLNLMLTESCNLDCFMCDFGKRNKRMKRLPLSVEEVMDLLDRPLFKSSLRALTLTGGEPFMFPEIEKLSSALRERKPHLKINYSSNATLLKRMLPVFDAVKDWDKVALFVSIDGIDKHDEQRGVEGSFELTVKNLEELRRRYPSLAITVKFTVTPVNYVELKKTFDYFNARGFRITAKMVENNPNYTNNLTHEQRDEEFQFTREQLDSIRAQLKELLREWSAPRSRRYQEVVELLDSLNDNWRRTGKCLTPRQGGFIDCDLNFFSCKEHPAAFNLSRGTLDQLENSPSYWAVVEHEEKNTGACTRCTSLLKMPAKRERKSWLGYVASWIR